MASPYGVDRLMAGIEIDDTNDTIRVDISPGGPQDVVIPHGTYWPYIGSVVAGYPSIYAQLITSFGAAGSVVSFSAITPTSSTLNTNGGVRMTVDGNFVELLNSELAFTFPMQVFGFAYDDQSDPAPSGGNIDGPFSIGFTWIPYRIASRKLADDTQEEYSSGPEEDEFSYTWREGTPRAYVYERQPAGRVRFTRDLEDQCYADNALLALFDTNCNWQTVYRSARRGVPVIVVHNEGDQDAGVISHPYEIARLEQGQRASFNTTIELTKPQGERYTVSFTLKKLEGTYLHS